MEKGLSKWILSIFIGVKHTIAQILSCASGRLMAISHPYHSQKNGLQASIMAKQPKSTARVAKDFTDKDAPLKEDIRLLGRLLGDVLRDQEGESVFDVVETIRRTAVRFRR